MGEFWDYAFCVHASVPLCDDAFSGSRLAFFVAQEVCAYEQNRLLCAVIGTDIFQAA